MDNFDLKKYLAEGRLLSEVNSKPKIEIEDGEMYLDYSGSTGTSSFGGLKSPVFRVTIIGPKDDPKNQKYMIYWKEDTEDWEWERGNMKRQLRNSITSYAKRYLPIKDTEWTKDSLLKALGDADNAPIQLKDGRELIIYNPNSNNDDNADMWGDDTIFAVDQDGQEEEVDYRDIDGIWPYGR